MTITVLNVGEKPAVAKAISNILSNGHPERLRNYSKYNPVFQFPYQLQGQNCKMIFTSVLGHLLSRDFSPEVKKWWSCPPSQLFDEKIHQILPEKMKDIDKTLRTYARQSDWLVLWLDFDREGENISYEVMTRCLMVNRNLKVLRAKFSSLVPNEIIYSCNHLIEPDKNKSDASEARCELDLRVGSAFTRLQTMFLQKTVPELKDLVISYGPCQFPTLGFVVHRYWEVEDFIPEAFWKIEVKEKRTKKSEMQDDRLFVANFNWERIHLFDHASSFVLYEMCIESPMAKVISVNQKRTQKYKPVPMNTIELQKLATKRLRMASVKVMEVAESLYRQGFISYPRTETNIFSPGTDLKALVSLQGSHPVWGGYANKLMQGGFRPPRNGKSNDQSHPPIHPTKEGHVFAKPEEKNLYEIISRHFLAVCSENAEAYQTKVVIDIAKEKFTATGLMVTAENFLEIYIYQSWSSHMMPTFKEGEQFVPSEILFREGRTQAPNLLTEPELIDLMDKKGIGTDATIAQHISTIQTREYASKEGTYFAPTTLGLALIEGYQGMGFVLDQPELRATMEKDLEKICQGTLTKDAVTAKYIKQYRDIFSDLELRRDLLARTCKKYFQE